jgi:hypothetical protein
VRSLSTARLDDDAADDVLACMRNDVEQGGVVFNDPAWAGVVSECYGFRDCSVTTAGGSLPLFHTRSRLLGDKVVSAVYNSYASPLSADAHTSRELVEQAIAIARARNVAYLQLKCLFPLPDEVVSACGLVRRDSYRVTFVPLDDATPRAHRYSANFRRTLRRSYRAVGDAGLTIERTSSAEDVARFYEVLVRRYRDKHLMIPQPWRLFELLRTQFLSTSRGDLWLARSARNKIASGVLCLRHGRIVTACFGARDAAYDHLSVDAALKDAMMEHYANEGLKVFDLGITSPRQETVLFSKSRYGGVTVPMPSYYFLVRAERVPDIDYASAYMWARRAFRYVPLAAVRRLSPVLVPYLN